MSSQTTSSLPPNKGTITHSQKRLEHLTKAAVERAYKLLTESRRLVQIVETHSCGNSKGLGCSNPFSSLSSVLLKNCSSTTPSSSKNWALSKDSNARRSVAARIHTFLNQWRVDCSFDWRARVASVVPVLEEVLYKEAKSEEEYTNPQLLESQLMNVLCHFEAGNGPFLLQGSSPVYPVRACYPPSSSSDRMSPFCQHALGEGMPSNGDSVEIASEEIHERARLTCTQSSALGSSPILTETVPNGWEANDMSTNKHGGHASSKIVKKVASILSKKRREKSECLKQELESADQGAETVESINAEIDAVGSVETNNDGMGNERMRRTLGGMLKLNMFNIESSSEMNAEAAPLASSTTTSEDTFVFHTEEAPLSLSTTGEISHHRISNVGEEAPDLGCILDSQTSEVGTLANSHSSLVEIVQAQGVSCLFESMSQSLVPSLSSTSTSTRPPPPLPPSSSSSSSSSWSSSSTSASLPCRSMSYSASSPSSVSAPSPSRLVLQHQASLSIPSLSCSSSSSPPQQRFTHTSITCLKSLPRHHSSSVSQKLAPFSTPSDVTSMELNYLKHEDHQSGAVNEHSTIQTTPQDCREIERGESSSTSSPSASSEEVSKRREKGVKLPLSSFLAEREEYMGSISSYEKGGPWDTWEETTEPLDGMCCVCMVGFKGAAFIPCGHTFCRKCSRELWRGRGTCPLCNRYIREILDIY